MQDHDHYRQHTLITPSASAGDLSQTGLLDAVTPKAMMNHTNKQDYFDPNPQSFAQPAPREPQSSVQSQQRSQQQQQQQQQDPSPSKSSLKPLSLPMHKPMPQPPVRSHSSQTLQGIKNTLPHPSLLVRRQASAAANFPISASQPSLQSLQHVHHSFTGSGSNQPPWYTSDKYSLAQMSHAMDKMEGRSTEVKSGEVGTSVGAVGFGGGDEWQTICVRVLPLFNGETAKGYVEELNDLVTSHARRILDRAPNRALVYLTQHFTELSDMGMLTLADKLEHTAGYGLLSHLNELWVLFWGAIRPYLLAVFLPYANDAALMAAATKIGQSRHKPPIDVERLLCQSFRDQVISPLADRLAPMFVREAFETGTASRRSSVGLNDASRTSSAMSLQNRLSESTRTVHQDSPAFNVKQPSNEERNVGRALRMQMISILAMLRTGDIGSERTDALAASLRGFGSTKLAPVDDRHWGHRRGTMTGRTGTSSHLQEPPWGWAANASDEEESDLEGYDETRRTFSARTSDVESGEEEGW